MKKLIFFLILFLSQTVNSEEIKLLCKVNGKKSVSNKSYYEDFQVNEDMLIKINKGQKGRQMIDFEVKGNTFIRTFVVTWFGENVIDVINNSGANHWNISNRTKYDKDEEGTLSISIDRNSGMVNVSELYTYNSEAFSKTDVSGHCQKIDTEKRKF